MHAFQKTSILDPRKRFLKFHDYLIRFFIDEEFLWAPRFVDIKVQTIAVEFNFNRNFHSNVWKFEPETGTRGVLQNNCS